MKNKKFLAMIMALTMVVGIAGCGAKADKKETGAKDNNTKVESSVDEKDDVEKDSKNESEVEVSGNVSENETVTEKEETQKIETDNKKNDTTTNIETNKNNTTTNKNESTSNKNETTTKPSTGNTDSNKKPSTGSTTKPNTGSTGSTNNSGNTGNTQNNNGGTTQPSTPVHEHKWTEVTEDEIHYYAWRTLCGKCELDMTDMSDEDLTYHSAIICNSRYSTKYIEVNFVTENIVKTPVVTGYKCECGATKGK